MLKIAVCDDDSRDAEKLVQLAQKALFARTEYCFTRYQNGREVVDAVRAGRFDSELLFLDIHMKQMDGMKVAAFLREQETDVDLIFATVSQSHVFEGYTYRAFAYLLKPLKEDRLNRELNRYLDEKEKHTECLNISVRGTTHRIPLDKIRYFESQARTVTVHIQGAEELRFYARMDELEELLEKKGFLRCHQSYLVNRGCVTSVSRTELELKDGRLPISRRYWEKLKQTPGIAQTNREGREQK